MATYGLFLETERCPDGVEYRASKGKPGAFHFRTDRREPKRLELENLERPVVISFVNARDESKVASVRGGKIIEFRPREENRALNFLSTYGMLKSNNKQENYEFFERCRRQFSFWLHDAAETWGEAKQDARIRALNSIHDLVGRYGALDLRPTFDLGGEGGAPRVLLQSPDLLAFMTMEVAMIAMNDAQFRVCGHCNDIFITGPLTWRRSHAKFCSDRCRVAAMRERNREPSRGG